MTKIDILQAVINMSFLVVLRWFLGKRYSGWVGFWILMFVCFVAYLLDKLSLGSFIDFSPVTWRFVIFIFSIVLTTCIVLFLNKYIFFEFDSEEPASFLTIF